MAWDVEVITPHLAIRNYSQIILLLKQITVYTEEKREDTLFIWNQSSYEMMYTEMQGKYKKWRNGNKICFISTTFSVDLKLRVQASSQSLVLRRPDAPSLTICCFCCHAVIWIFSRGLQTHVCTLVVVFSHLLHHISTLVTRTDHDTKWRRNPSPRRCFSFICTASRTL